MASGRAHPQPRHHDIAGAFSQTATLYQDGVSLATAQITKPATASATGYVADLGSGSNGFFNGSIADVSLYTSELTSDQVASHYSALQDQVVIADAGGGALFGGTTVTLPTLNTQTITVTDPVGKNAVYLYDAGGSLVQSTDVRGGTTYYGYDDANRASTITDPDGDTTYMTYDAHNNVTSTTTCAAINNCQTAYASYLREPVQPARSAQRQADRLARRPLVFADRPHVRHRHHLHGHRPRSRPRRHRPPRPARPAAPRPTPIPPGPRPPSAAGPSRPGCWPR